MPDIDVFDANGNFTAGFKYKLAEHLRDIPLSDNQVEAITKALTVILREAIRQDADKQRALMEELIAPLRYELKDLEDTVKAHENQAKGMKKILLAVAFIVGILGTLTTIYQVLKPDPTSMVLERILERLPNENNPKGSTPTPSR